MKIQPAALLTMVLTMVATALGRVVSRSTSNENEATNQRHRAGQDSFDPKLHLRASFQLGLPINQQLIQNDGLALPHIRLPVELDQIILGRRTGKWMSRNGVTKKGDAGGSAPTSTPGIKRTITRVIEGMLATAMLAARGQVAAPEILA